MPFAKGSAAHITTASTEPREGETSMQQHAPGLHSAASRWPNETRAATEPPDSEQMHAAMHQRRQTDRQTDRQTSRQTDRQPERTPAASRESEGTRQQRRPTGHRASLRFSTAWAVGNRQRDSNSASRQPRCTCTLACVLTQLNATEHDRGRQRDRQTRSAGRAYSSSPHPQPRADLPSRPAGSRRR